ncbi:HAD hydrolase-like protein [Candidatus Kaiserbacteria bacterium]|nr:HAD hydrolase-like protein [Candidatus Kaiserbacteria bacterium]
MNSKGDIAVIFDFNRTIYDPETGGMLSGARAVLDTLRARAVPLYLVSKADESRPQLLEELGVKDFFTESFFVERKDPTLFFEILRRADVHPKQMYVVGDHLHKEIRCGNQCGMRTIWLKRGKFADLEPAIEADHPWKTVGEMDEVLGLIE